MPAVQTKTIRFPGDRSLKVDHAGEHGAVCIYSAQIMMAHITARDMVAELRDFRQHERQHRTIFENELQQRALRRCRSYWLCGVGGFVLGLVSGLLGRRAIAATTFAVERVVLRHLDHQLRELQDDVDAVIAISKIVADEKLHHDLSAAHLRDNSLVETMLMPVVSMATESVIRLGMCL